MHLQIIETLVLIVHVLSALAIIGLVLLQQGKGADMGSGFGAGASSTVFGSAGSGNFLTRTTTALAITFFATSIGLAYFAKEHAIEARQVGIPATVQEAPAKAQDSDEAPTTGSSPDSEIPQAAAPADKGSEVPKQ